MDQRIGKAKMKFVELKISKALRLTTFLIFLICGFVQASAQDVSTDQKDALKGLKGVYVLGGDVDPGLKGIAKKTLLSDIETALHTASIPVLDEERWLFAEGSPALYLDITISESVAGQCGYSIRLELQELVSPLSNPAVTTYGVIWSKNQTGIMNESEIGYTRQIVEQLTDQFITDYHAANP